MTTSLNLRNTLGRRLTATEIDANFTNLRSTADAATVDSFTAAGTGATARTYRAKNRDIVSVKDYGAVGDGTTDDTAAIQAALAASLQVHFPAGTYKTTANLATRVEHHITGSGMGVTIIVPTGAGIHGFVEPTSGSYTRCTIENLSISGGSTTGSGIYFPTLLAYRTVLRNIEVIMGGDAFYLPNEFNTLFENCFASSSTGHGFYTLGGNTTTFINTYAVSVPTAGKAGYRSLGGGAFISANGLDSGPNWGIFGAAIADGDAVNAQYYCHFIRCNIEAFTNRGMEFRYQGTATITSGSFTIVSGSYDCSIALKLASCAITIDGVKFVTSGGTRTKLAEVYGAVAGNECKFIGYKVADIPSIEEAGTLRSGGSDPIQATSWTPVLRGSGTAGTNTYGTQLGKYVINGSMVTAWFRITTTAVDGAMTGNVQITGLPFTQNVGEGASLVGGSFGRWGGITFTGGYTMPTCEISAGSATISVLKAGTALAPANLPVGELGAATTLWGVVTYLKT